MPENKVQITIEAIDNAKAVLTDLQKALLGVETQTKSVGKESQALGGILTTLKQNWAALSIGVNQALEIFNKAIQIPQKMVAWGEMGAQVMRTEQAFKSVAEAAGQSSDAIVAGLVRASKATMDSTDVMQRAGRLMQEGIAPSKIQELMAYLQRQAPVVGDTIQEAWDKIGMALTTGNMRAVKQYTGFIDLERELSIYADKLGVTKDRLSEQGRQTAIFEIVLSKLAETTKKTGDTTDRFSESMSRSKASIKNSLEELQKAIVPQAAALEALAAAMLKVITRSDAVNKKWQEQHQIKALEAAGITNAKEVLDAMAKEPYQATAASPSPIADRSPEQKREFQSFRLTTEAKILELNHQEEEAIKRRQAAEIAGEGDREKQAIMTIRHVAELEDFRIRKALERQAIVEKADQEAEAEGERIAREQEQIDDQKVQRELSRLKNIDQLQEEGEQKADQRNREMSEQAIQRWTTVADNIRRARDWRPTIEESLKGTMGDIGKQGDAYQQMFESTRKYAKEFTYFRKLQLDQELEDLREAGMKEEDIQALKAQKLREIYRKTDEMEVAWDAVGSNMQQAFQAGFFDLYKKKITDLGQVFKDFCENMVQSWFRAMSQMASNAIMFGNIAGYKPGEAPGGLLGWLRGLLNWESSGGPGPQTPGMIGYQGTGFEAAGLYHSGGMVPEGGRPRWMAVPRLHSGLADDEFAAILQKGERVLSRKEVAGGAGAPNVRVNIQVNNQAGVQTKVKERGFRFDGTEWVKNIMVDLSQSDMTICSTYGLR